MSPLKTDVPLRSVPWVNLALILAMVALHIVVVLEPETSPRGALSARDPRLVQFLTYPFLHLGLLHLLGNVLAQALFGGNINDRMGHLGYAAFFLAGGVVAGMGFLATTRSGAVVGASGAIGAVIGAYLVLLPKANIVLFERVRIPSIYPITAYFILNLVMAISTTTLVARWAHISGLVFGVALTLVLLALKIIPPDEQDAISLVSHFRRQSTQDRDGKEERPT